MPSRLTDCIFPLTPFRCALLLTLGRRPRPQYMYSASPPNMRLKFMPPPAPPTKELPTKLRTSPRPRPSPPPTVKLKRLKSNCADSNCAEADVMSPQKTSKNSIRFFNLDLLFLSAKLYSHASKAVLPRRRFFT